MQNIEKKLELINAFIIPSGILLLIVAIQLVLIVSCRSLQTTEIVFYENISKVVMLPSAGYGQSSINLSIYRRNAMLSIGNKQLIGYMGGTGEIYLVTRNLV
jgi:hypothetical protein